MHALVPYLNFNGNCEEAMNFYAHALSGSVLFKQTFAEAPGDSFPAEVKDKILHMSISFGKNLVIMASDCPPGVTVSFGNNLNLSIDFESREEADKAFALLAEGGNIIMPLEDTFWGAYFGMLVDKFGINWMFNYDKA